MANSNFNSSIGFNIGCSRDTDYDVAVADAFAILLVQLAMACMMKNRINRLFEIFKEKGEQYGTVFFLWGLYLLAVLIDSAIATACLNG